MNKELMKNVRAMVEEHFDKKLKHSSYYGLQELWDIVEDCVCEVQDIADDYDKKIDDYIQEIEDKKEMEIEELKGKGIFI